MSMSDPLADLLTRIRNANRIGRVAVDCPSSRLKKGTLEVLRREGFIRDFKATILRDIEPMDERRPAIKVAFGGLVSWCMYAAVVGLRYTVASRVPSLSRR